MTIKQAQERYEQTLRDIEEEKLKRISLLRSVSEKAADELLPFQYDYNLASGLPHVGIELGTDKEWYLKYTHGHVNLRTAPDNDWDNFGKIFQAFLQSYATARIEEVLRLQTENRELEEMLAEL